MDDEVDPRVEERRRLAKITHEPGRDLPPSVSSSPKGVVELTRERAPYELILLRALRRSMQAHFISPVRPEHMEEAQRLLGELHRLETDPSWVFDARAL